MIVAHRSYGLPVALVRNVLTFALAVVAVVVQASVLKVDLDGQQVSWLAVAAFVGVLGGVVSRDLPGFFFLIGGLVVGFMGVFAVQLGSTSAVTAEFARHGATYLELMEVAALGYLLVVIAWRRARPR